MASALSSSQTHEQSLSLTIERLCKSVHAKHSQSPNLALDKQTAAQVVLRNLCSTLGTARKRKHTPDEKRSGQQKKKILKTKKKVRVRSFFAESTYSSQNRCPFLHCTGDFIMHMQTGHITVCPSSLSTIRSSVSIKLTTCLMAKPPYYYQNFPSFFGIF